MLMDIKEYFLQSIGHAECGIYLKSSMHGLFMGYRRAPNFRASKISWIFPN